MAFEARTVTFDKPGVYATLAMPETIAGALDEVRRGDLIARVRLLNPAGDERSGAELILRRGLPPSPTHIPYGQIVGRPLVIPSTIVGPDESGVTRTSLNGTEEEVLEINLKLMPGDRRSSAHVELTIGERTVRVRATRGRNNELEVGSDGPDGNFIRGGVIFAVDQVGELPITFRSVVISE